MPVAPRDNVPRVEEDRHRQGRNGNSPVVDEGSFAQLLVRERKRSERSNRPFILLSLTVKDPRDTASSGARTTFVETLAAVKRGTDVLGWVKWPTTVGVLFLEIGEAAPARAIVTLRARVHRELCRRLDAKALDTCSLEFRVYPESSESDPESGPGPADPVFHPDLRREQRARRLSDWIKRALDIFASVALLLWLAPLLLLVAAVVRLTSPGPILFRQLRIGKMGTPFRMLKFRTMYIDADEARHREFITGFIKQSGRIESPSADRIFKLTDDPRITPVGRFLRKTSIDEVPQLWNVLIGQMSLVGPRPPLQYELRHYASWHRRRILEAKPGITGLWQVTGRSRTTFDEMVRLDLRYARTRSIWTDLRILLRTPAAVVGGKGAG